MTNYNLTEEVLSGNFFFIDGYYMAIVFMVTL